jgi:polyhydroxybutyrate depolymerase
MTVRKANRRRWGAGGLAAALLLAAVGLAATPRAGWALDEEDCAAPIDLGRGQVPVYIPEGYDPKTPAPLVVLLHGYAATGLLEELYLRLRPLADELGFLYAFPDGTTDRVGLHFWNATDACCDEFDTGVDDSAYLTQLIRQIRSQCSVDKRRIGLVGHSNGGFMAYRMACDHARLISAVASFAGATYEDPKDCSPSEPVHVLQVHGTADDRIFYDGGKIFGTSYPGAEETTEIWADYNGCAIEPEDASQRMNSVRNVAGRETVLTTVGARCEEGGSSELWTIRKGGHIPLLTGEFRESLAEWVVGHPKCRGRERVHRATCNGSGLHLRTVGGTAGDHVTARLDDGTVLDGQLDERGRLRLDFAAPESGAGGVSMEWACGAADEASYSCP